MTENIGASMFKPYADAFKHWSDTVNSWTANTAGGFTDMFKTDGFNPWGFINDWDKAGAELMKALPFSPESMGNVNEKVTEAAESYRKICDTWARSMSDLVREGQEMNLKALSGEDIDTDKIFDGLRSAYNEITETTVATLKGTPFEDIKEIDAAVKQAMDQFSDEQTQAKALFKEMTVFNTRVSELLVSATREATGVFTDVKKTGAISADACKKIIGAYGATLKKTMAILDVPESLLPECSETVDKTMCLAAKNLDVFTSWLEISLKSTYAFSRSADDMRGFAEDTFKLVNDGKTPSQEAFYQKWSESSEKIIRELIRNSQFNGSIPKFINVCTDCVKSANDHYRNLMVFPYTAVKQTRVPVKNPKEPVSQPVAN